MQEYLEISFHPVGKVSSALAARMQSWREKGYVLEQQYGIKTPWFKMLVPLGDESWRDEIVATVKAKLVTSDWHANFIQDVYSPVDFAHAPLFGIIHTGRDIDFPMGRDDIASVTHIMDVDQSDACAACGAGTRQNCPLRLPASDLNKAGKCASIWIGDNAFFMLTEQLAGELSEECSDELPLLEIETIGKIKLKERWLQIVPEFVVPESAIVERRVKRIECPECGAVRGEALPGPISGVCFTARESALNKVRLPAASLCPVWEGGIERFPDGRIISYPERRLWLRGDLGRALAKKKIRDLELVPIIFA
ncbi:MAG TPA: hypothetical protein VFF69_14285 [Phycisphaerales bacterium]|nr:hypothetical protein [Phycisphaerales bacterium]